MNGLFGWMCVRDVKCEPCGQALGRFVRIPEPWADRHARVHAAGVEDPLALAKATADLMAITLFQPPLGVWSTASW